MFFFNSVCFLCACEQICAVFLSINHTIAGSINDNINMDITSAESMNDKINIDSAIAESMNVNVLMDNTIAVNE